MVHNHYFPDYVEATVEVLEIVDGSACTIEADNSHVKLHVPSGIEGAIVGQTHQITSEFEHIIPKDECLVGPICQFTLQPKSGTEIPKGAKYKIQISHLIPHVNKVKDHIRIRHGDIHNDNLMKAADDISFDIDDKYITILTTHSSTYIVTVEGINCFSSRATVLLFGSLDNPPDEEALVSLRIYMTKDTSDIKDYEKVGM